MRPLDGIRVLDFTWVVAGPVATRVLADFGADVVKVERENATNFGDRRGGLTGCLMRGKRSVVLNLADPRGLAIARDLAVTSDVVVDNFSARVMPNLGLDHASLRARNPRLVCLRMTGYGLDGPDRDKVSYGPSLQALTGYTALMGQPDGSPAGFGYSYSDVAAGHLGALAVVAALFRRRRSGEGCEIDLAQQETVASLVGPLLLERAASGAASTTPLGNASQEGAAAPHGLYPCAGDDRWLAITVFGDAEWRALRTALGAPAWSDDPRFATEAGRVADAPALDAHLAAWTRTQDADTAMTRLQAHGVRAARVSDARDVCTRDPQLAVRRHFVDVPTPEGASVRLDAPAILLDDTPGAVGGPGPLLGEHTDDVLRTRLGFDDATLASLRADRVIA